jgi:hypothetical protein
VHPAIPYRLVGFLRVTPVPQHRQVTSNANFTLLSNRHNIASFI